MKLAAVVLALSGVAHADTRLLRFPDVSDTHITFVYAGDVYLVARSGGLAQRLTSGPGMELFPKFSPDGTQIAFSAEYSGTRQVWVMPADGSAPPRQLTYYTDVGPMPPRGGFDYRVLDWTPDGQNILVRMNRFPLDERAGRPFLVPVAGGMETPLRVPETGGGMLSPDGNAYVYTPIDREFRTWKRTRGGRAQDVWVYDLKNDTSRQLTNHRGTDNQPTWVGDAIYFTSDREYTLNLWRTSPNGGEVARVTSFTDFDVLWPSAGRDAIVFEQAGRLWLHTPVDGATNPVTITVQGDRPHLLPTFKNVAAQIEGFDLAPGAERALVSARGELFTVPARNGEIRNISGTPGARELAASFTPDGKSVVFLSDASGEYELYSRASDGSGEPKRITTDGNIWRFPPTISPDGKRIVYGDQNNQLRLVEIESGRTIDIDRASTGNAITTYVFSPDSQHIVYVKTDATGLSRLWHYPVGGQTAQLTHGLFNADSPSFDPEGRYLYFTSDREHNLQFSAYEFNYLYINATRLFAATLDKNGAALGRPKSDEIGAAKDKPEEPNGSKKEAAKAPLKFDRDGFDARAVMLAPGAGNYRALSATKNGLAYLAQSNAQAPAELKFYSLADEKESTVLKGVANYTLRGEQVLFATQDQKLGIAELKPDQDASKTLDLSRLMLKIDPPVEWAQLLRDGWRIWRDWFYDPGMHGNDWEAVYRKYAALLPHVAHRADLDYLLNEMAGELNAGHIYVERGDEPQVERKPGGFLGADIVADSSGYFKIERIFPGQNHSEPFRSPLTEAGVDVSPGEFIIAVDGVSTRSVKNFYELLENKAARIVDLRINSRADAGSSRLVRVKTQTSEDQLRYLDFVEQRRAMVDKLSGGRIGYVHLPNTLFEGNRELFKQFPSQINKEAMIVDDRYNGGGFIPDRMIEILARKPLNYWKRRGLDPQAQPFLSHRGPKAMLINGLSSSGGDALPYYFKQLNLGPLIGTRTWGGLIGVSGNPRLADGGTTTAATFRFMGPDGEWAVENEGVAPDIEVIDTPHLVAQGRDPSLEKAIEVLLAELEKNPVKPISAPPAPSDFGAPGKPLD